MPNRSRSLVVAFAALFGALCLLPGAALAQPSLPIELNKLEQRDNDACRAYMVFQNKLGEAISALRLCLVPMIWSLCRS